MKKSSIQKCDIKLKVLFCSYIHLIDHIHEFGLRWVLSQGSHHSSKLLGSDGTCARIQIEKIGPGRNDERTSAFRSEYLRNTDK